MVIEYKINFEEDGVTIRQNVVPHAAEINDEAGEGVTPNPDDGGTGVTPNPDDGGSRPGGRGRVAAIVLGPVIIFGGARPAGPKIIKGESVKNIPVVPVPPADPPTR